MNKQELWEKYSNALMDMTNSGMEIERISQSKNMLAVYLRMFHDVPHFVSTDYDSTYYCIEDYKSPYDDMDPYKTLKKFTIENAEDCISIRNFDTRIVIMDHLIMCCDEDSIYGCYEFEKFPKALEDCVVKSTEEDVKYMQYVTSSGNGFSTMDMEVKKQECDIESNYNDDLPYNKVEEFINGDESGLIILFGIAGSGNFLKFCA